MRFLSAWTEVGMPTLVLALLAPGVLLFSALLPGRRTARIAAAAVALLVLTLGVLGLEGGIRWGWSALWGLIAWRVGRPRPRTPQPMPRPGGVESGAIGLLLSLALIVLMISAVARSNSGANETRIASYGLLLVAIGLLHLMLRRDAVRALLAFGALGLGLQILLVGARDDLLGTGIENQGAMLLASALSLALTDRVVRAREASAGTPWVSEAHDLHD
jgi:hypothetical protein